MKDSREQFKTRLGFLLIAAGCAIGLGNVWRFPYIAGQYGGAVFVAVYLLFLFLIGVPIVTMELSVGRASHNSVGYSFETLTPNKKFWHKTKYLMILGNYILLGFYTMVTGWMLYYTCKVINGDFVSQAIGQDVSGGFFGAMLGDYKTQIITTVIVTSTAFFVCALGLKKGVERITKPLMILLFGLLIFLAGRSFFLPGFADGISYYLKPDFSKFASNDIFATLYAAIGQACFTLGIGVGSLQIFGSYMNSQKSILSETISIAVLVGEDNVADLPKWKAALALLAGIIIFPACFSYNVEPDSGPGLIFVTLVSVFSSMQYGIFWGGLFFMFMLLAAMSTLIAIIENVVGISMDLFNCSRVKAVAVNLIVILLCALPVILGFNVLKDFHPLGGETVVLDLYDFVLSQNILEIGAIIYIVYTTYKFGWGFDNYLKETNTGVGVKLPALCRAYFKFVLPLVLIVLMVKGYLSVFGN